MAILPKTIYYKYDSWTKIGMMIARFLNQLFPISLTVVTKGTRE